MFARLGFFGVEQGRRRGAVQFLRTSEAILQNPNHLLAITPQSRFADVRERPLRFQSGLGRVCCRRLRTRCFFPWRRNSSSGRNDCRRFSSGSASRFWSTPPPDAAELTRSCPRKVLEAQLTESRSTRLPSRRNGAMHRTFRTILRGGAGQGGIYDLWRKLKASSGAKPSRRSMDANELELIAVVPLVLAAIPAALFLANPSCSTAALQSCCRRESAQEHPTEPPYALSVLIPARNEEKNIRATLEAVLANRGAEFEIIVLDDHSTDQTAAIVEAFARRRSARAIGIRAASALRAGVASNTPAPCWPGSREIHCWCSLMRMFD